MMMSSQKEKESRGARKWGKERRRKEGTNEGGRDNGGKKEVKECEVGNTSSICSECSISHAEFYPTKDADRMDLLAGMENTSTKTFLSLDGLY